MATLWKDAVSAYFRANRTKLCVNCAFPQNSYTKKLGEIVVFFAVWAKTFSAPVFRKKISVSDDLITHVTNFLRTGLTRQ